MPKQLKSELELLVSRGRYTSLSEVMREGARKVLKSNQALTVNGFTQEFEDETLKEASEKIDKRSILDTPDEVTQHFNKLFEESKSLSEK
jgi:Arc/MetJ-type ribon-helix-helix transcriptional regulator